MLENFAESPDVWPCQLLQPACPKEKKTNKSYKNRSLHAYKAACSSHSIRLEVLSQNKEVGLPWHRSVLATFSMRMALVSASKADFADPWGMPSELIQDDVSIWPSYIAALHGISMNIAKC